jgi:hypothetical protein
MMKTDGSKILIDAFKVITINGRDRFPNYRGIFQLGSE